VTGTSTEIGPDLVDRARGGNPEALETLVTHAYPVVHRWALVRTGDLAEADDLTQDVLVQVIRRLDAYEGSSRFTTWLYAVTRNAAADRFRRRKRRHRLEDDPRTPTAVLPDAPPPADELVGRGELAGVVRTFFRELPPRQREVFDLADLQGLPSPEIAARLGIEPVSVRAHLFKARRALRARILEAYPLLAEDLS
jgi:RNA polymerase sigma-70 factor (ECF subfamily)